MAAAEETPAVAEDAVKEPLQEVDEAVDVILEAFATLDRCMPKLTGATIPQKAAIDAAAEAYAAGVKPYFADVVAMLQALEDRT